MDLSSKRDVPGAFEYFDDGSYGKAKQGNLESVKMNGECLITIGNLMLWSGWK